MKLYFINHGGIVINFPECSNLFKIFQLSKLFWKEINIFQKLSKILSTPNLCVYIY